MAVIWKGAISFGLVHIPVSLKPGAHEHRLSFDMVDRRDMAPIGYTRVNKSTGKPVEWKDIAKGFRIEQGSEKGEYVLMSDEDFRRANPEATQTVEILAFVDAASIPPYYYETPYYLEPDKRGKKPYALLRAAMKKSGRVGIARFVVHTKEHIAAMIVHDRALMLITLRFADEIQPADDLDLPANGSKAESVSPGEIAMASRLIDDMTEEWKPERYKDSYRDDLMAAIQKKIKAGKTRELTEPDKSDQGPARESAKVIDLVALLKQSMGGKGKKVRAPASDDAGDQKAATGKVAKRSISRTASATKSAPRKRTPVKRKAA
jgi:DNA end-binding protein Ku